MPVLVVTDASDARLDVFRGVRDAVLRQRHSAAGFYIAESLPVLERAIAAGHDVSAVMAAARRVTDVRMTVGEDVNVFQVSADVAEAVAGYDVHRGVIAVVHRPRERNLSDVLDGAATIVVLDGVTDSTNLGAIFRNAAALGADGVVMLNDTADPLYRRSTRVSMGAVFQVPWARARSWEQLAPELAARGHVIIALALRDDATDLRDVVRPQRVALVLGAEGPGVTAETLGVAQTIVRIPMQRGVDSLNVAATSAVVLWALQRL